MDVAILITIFVVGFAMGMYVTTQIGEWIDRQIKKK